MSANTSTTAGKRARAMPPEERRVAIVEAALPLLVEHGERVTTRQIAEAAGIAEGTIFRAFADKDELLTAALDAALDLRPLERALGAIDPAATFEERLVVATELLQARVANVWAIVSALGPAFHARAHPPITDSAALTALFEPERDRLRIEPAAGAHLLRALTLSLTHPMLVGSPVPAAEIVATVLHGIEVPRRERPS